MKRGGNARVTLTKRRLWLALAAMALAACTAKEPVPLTPPGQAAGAAVVRRAVPEPAPAVVAKAPPTAPAAPAAPASTAPAAFPAGALYVCVEESGGARKETVIEFSPQVGDLCRKHPEMSPCQYERELCRRGGGRVYAAGGFEITRQVEAEYDRKVMRVRFKAN